MNTIYAYTDNDREYFGRYRIGQTGRDAETRVAEQDTTSQALPLRIIKTWEVPDHITDEVIQAELERMGLPKDAWFVCLHVREGGWHNDAMVERNASILNYSEAIKEVTCRGGWVIRMGDSTMSKLPVMERVVDYPFTPSKSYAMDLYLLSECRAYIGMQSGIYSVAFMFQRPMVITNMASWFYPFPHMPGDIGVLKHVYSKSKKRFLSVREWMSEGLQATSFRELDDDFVLHENTPDELRAAVKECFDRGENVDPTPLQREYNELRISRGHEILSKPIRPQDGIKAAQLLQAILGQTRDLDSLLDEAFRDDSAVEWTNEGRRHLVRVKFTSGAASPSSPKSRQAVHWPNACARSCG